MSDTEPTNESESVEVPRSALTMAMVVATGLMVLRLAITREPLESVAMGLLAGVVVYLLAFIAHRR